MTLIDMIELYNVQKGLELDNVESIFADIDIDARIDKSTLVGSIIDVCGAMDCIYNTTPTFKYFSDNFFKKYKWNITRLLDTLEFEYDPMKTKSMQWTETTDIQQNLDTAEESGENRNRANTGTQKNEYEENEENTISAMNSSSYQPDNKSDRDGENTRTDNLNEAITSEKERNKNEALDWDETDTHVESGNDGSPYQDLIEKERKVSQFNIYNWISNKYAKELFLLVY